MHFYPEDKQVKSEEFFSAMFCGDLLPDRKVDWILKNKEAGREHKNCEIVKSKIETLKGR